jgi:toxin CcdB
MISERTAMRQFDVFENPIVRARRAYPFVAVLQSDRAETGHDRIVAPLVPRARLSGTAGRLTPHVKVSGVDHVLLVPGMTAVAAADLRDVRDELTSHRNDIIAALDYLFLGV